MKKKLYLMIAIVCILAAVGMVAGMVVQGIQENQQQEIYEDLAEAVGDNAVAEANQKPEVTGEEPVEKEELTEEELLEAKYKALEEKYDIEIPRKNIDFEELQANTNQDIYAWIYVPNTQVDYPVLQHPEDNFHYLNYNMDGSKGLPGCIYTEMRNEKDFMDGLTVLYGHNMKNGSMFAELHKYEDIEFFEQNPYFYIYTPDDILVYQVFRAYVYSDEHLVYKYGPAREQDITYILDDIRDFRSINSNVNQELLDSMNGEDKICTLSTCVANQSTSRYLVQGVLCSED